ncbi:MAG TPA: glycine cleavage system aminomethyltransferase GcvT [Smithellaceae bacterium]|jgi:aminomethyltransferase|nr:glycine cleavage system aminomethyltransferase GcvT [Smithella sp.]HOQ40765.1 glycine cleavage system aminomethyltransferase GcvT [Smithellaceae bacterium]HPL66781.1 glycine cleavage system aminomethyltransferase GcvT [Smithellaceae bacterium]
MKKTPLYEKHAALGAKIIDFGGWAMPVQYTNVIEEHKATRTASALFDICHMGEIEVRGPQAADLLQFALTRDLSGQKTGQVKLSALLNDRGGIIDDLTVYKMADDFFMLVTNATTQEADFQRIQAILDQKKFNCRMEDISGKTGKLDLQGPRAEEILQILADADLKSIRFYHFVESPVAGIPAIISRSGYTGEDGFEIYAAAEKISLIWDAMIGAGRTSGMKPAGLGARDTLRLEAGMMLNGQDMTQDMSPLEVPYGWLVDWDKDFAGKTGLVSLRDRGIAKKIAGLEMTGRGIARHGYAVKSGDKEIGMVTSGTFAPTLNKAVALAFIDTAFTAPDTEVSVVIRNTESAARVVKLPFYKRPK